ncbi:MAG: two-component regulator propeller domain-containing protein [Aggregatilineales bacterium]
MTRKPLSRRTVGFLLTLLLIMQLQIGFVNAQEPSPDDNPLTMTSVLRYSHLTSDDGLVQNRVTSILQDSTGFMWFATDAGLSRYDGYQFRTFQNDPNDENSLSHNYVRDIYEASDGMIWIATEGGGVNRLNPNTLEFTRYRANRHLLGTDDWHGINGDRHFSIFEDSRGHIWAGGGRAGGLSDYDPATDTAVFHPHDLENPEGLWGNGIRDIIETDDGLLWLVAETAVVSYDINENRFHPYDFTEFDEGRLLSVLQDSQGRIWAGGAKSLYLYNAENDRFDALPIVDDIQDMIEPVSGMLSVATNHGIYRVDLQTFEVLGHDEPYVGVPSSLNNSGIDVIYQDQAGKLWMGGDDGIDMYDPHRARFDFFRTRIPGAPSSFVAGEIGAIYISPQNTAWVAVESTLHRVDLDTHEISVYQLSDYGAEDAGISAIMQDSNGMLWIGNRQNQVYQFDAEAELLTRFPLTQPRPDPNDEQQAPPPQQAPTQPTRPRVIVSLAEDPSGRLWVASSSGGLYLIDETRENVTQYTGPEIPPPPDAPINTPIRPAINNVNIDATGKLWLANDNGYFRFDPTTETYQRYILLRMGADSVTEASLIDADGIVWVASADGLFRLDPETEAVRQFTMTDGLPTNSLVGILQDAEGDLWISTKRGLSRFTPSTETFHNYDVHDGLQGNEFNNHIFAQASDGRMFFGGSNGLTAFYPQNIVDSTYHPPLIIDNFELFNQPVLPGEDSPLSQPIWLTDAITLDYDQNILSFEFAALNYTFGAPNEYRYRLEGLETEWNDTEHSRRFATYTNLSAGDYVFRVQAANRDGVWSDNEVAISLTVLPPWWQTLWFRVLAALGVILVILGGYQWRVQSVQRRNSELQLEVNRQTQSLQTRTEELQTREVQLSQARDAAETANRAKSAFLANMSHELRSPLNAILGFTQLVTRTRTLPQDAHENLRVVLRSGEHLLSLINQVLDLSKIEAGHMSLNNTDFDLYRLLDDVEDMFILVAEDKHLTLKFSRAGDVPRYIHSDMTKLRQTLINLLSNALKFTVQGQVEVSVNTLATENTADASAIKLEFGVRDSGAGIPQEELSILFDAFAQTSSGRKAQEGTGLGLAISRNFVHLMGGDIRVQSAVGQGSTFTFDIACRVAQEIDIRSMHLNQHIIGLAPGQPTYRVLVVDDKRTNRQLLVKLLQPLGFEMREAENGDQAVKLAADFQPQMIFMDIRMPVMDGLEAFGRYPSARL